MKVQGVYKSRGTSDKVTFDDIFQKQNRKIDTFKYLLLRTQMRPRDLIAFINKILDASSAQSISPQDSTNSIPAKRISEAEEKYSYDRLQATLDEWTIVHPQLSEYITIMSKMKENFNFDDKDIEGKIENIALNLASCNGTKLKDSVRIAADNYYSNANNYNAIILKQEIFSTLYKVGIIKIKLSKGDRYKSSYEADETLLRSSIGSDTKIKIHPMFWRALGITPNQGN